jgi:hypothetical protein
VPFQHPASPAIESLQADDILTGCSASPRRFCPWDAATRAEAAVMAAHLAGNTEPATARETTFADLPSDRWDAGSAGRAWSRGWIAACGEAPLLFCPEISLTRREAAHLVVSMAPDLLSRAAGATPADVSDEREAREAFAVLHAGLLLPCQASPTLLFCPDAAVSRAELAQLLAGVRDALR